MMMFNPSLYGDYFELPNADQLTGKAPQVLNKLVEVLQDFKAAETAIKADPTKTEPARLIALDRLYRGRVAPLVAEATEAVKALASAPLAVETAKAAKFVPSKDTADLMLASEIRASISRMKPDARRELVSEAVETGDLKLISAIVGAPGFLSKIDKAEQHMIRDSYIARHAPDLAAITQAAEIVAARSGQTVAALEAVRSQFFSQADERTILSASAKADSAARHLENSGG
jgi:hypothetical protein